MLERTVCTGADIALVSILSAAILAACVLVVIFVWCLFQMHREGMFSARKLIVDLKSPCEG